jgi:hypothetical protein
MKRIGFALLAIAISSASALAADLPVKAPPMVAAPVFNWPVFISAASWEAPEPIVTPLRASR